MQGKTKKIKQIIEDLMDRNLISNNEMDLFIQGQRLEQEIKIQKRIEDALKVSERRTAEIIDSWPDATFVIDQDGRIIAWNKAAEDMTGIKADDMLNKGDFEYALPLYGIRRPILIDMVLKSDEPLEFGFYSHLERKGKILTGEKFCPAVGESGVYLTAVAFPLYDVQGTIIGAIESIRDITEAKKTKEELLRIKKALESASNVIMMTDEKGRYLTYHNPSFFALFGYTQETLNAIGGLPQLFLNSSFAYWVYDTIVSGQSWTGELEMRTASGTMVLVFMHADTVQDETGNIIGLFGILTDITEQKQGEIALLESQQLLANIIDFLPDATMVIDREGQVIAWNRAIEEMTGVKAEDMLGKGDHEYAIPLYGNRRPILIDLVLQPDAEIEKAYHFIKREKGVLIAENPIHSAKGEVSVWWGKANVLYDYKGNITGAIQSIRDVTERKKDERALLEAQQRMADIINFLPDATFVINLKGEVIAWNKAAEEMTGIKAEGIIGKGDYEYSKAFYGTRHPILIDLVLMPNEELEKNYPFIERKDKTLIGENFCPALGKLGAYLRATASTLYDSQGNIVGAIESIRDATEHKQAEERMEYLGMHDVLTGLYNRARFEEEMRRVENSQYVPVGIIMCDVDGLKLVNDTLGHKAGDNLLITASRVIKKAFREGDMIARVGGDEFSIILPLIDVNRLEDAASSIQREVDQYNQKNSEVPLSISIGFAFRHDKLLSLNELYKKADNNMYREKLRRSQSARSAIVKTLIKTLEARDFNTKEHASRLQKLLISLAKEIKLPVSKLNDLLLFAQFHDIGKVGIPDRILFKPGPHTDEEKIEMQRHSEIGNRIALASPDLVPIADWILKHHEWWNGQGYPMGAKELEIPIECRMLAIADAYDAMTSDRPYRKALTHEEAIAELIRGNNTQFDPYLVPIFIKVVDAI